MTDQWQPDTDGTQPSMGDEELLRRAHRDLLARFGPEHADVPQALRRAERIAKRRRIVRIGGTAVMLLLVAGAIAIPLASSASPNGQRIPPAHQGTTSASPATTGPPSSVPYRQATAHQPTTYPGTSAKCPTPLPARPVWVDSTLCDRPPGPGDGDGPTGQCTQAETTPPCGPGAVPGTYYPFTLPTTCTGRVWFDGRQWVSELPPGAGAVPTDVWMAIQATGTSAGWLGPGAVGLKPYAGQPLSCGSPVPVRKAVTPQVLANFTPPIPDYCHFTTVTTTGTLTRAINIARDQCIAANTPTTKEIWATTGTQLTPTQIVAQFKAEVGRPGTSVKEVYVAPKTTFAKAAQIVSTLGSPATITPQAPTYVVTIKWSTGRYTTFVIDAITGKGITTQCQGCNIVQANGTVLYTVVEG